MFIFLWTVLVVLLSAIATIQLVVATPLVVRKMGPLGLVFQITAGVELYRGFSAAISFDIWALAVPILIGLAAMATRTWLTR